MIHKIRGTVIHGNSLGRTIGFPTANLAISADLPLQDGVYIAEVNAGGEVYKAIVNVGTRPTVAGNGGRFVEAHLFGFSGDLYGKEIIVFMLGFIRPEVKFANLEELKSRIEADKAVATAYFESAGGQAEYDAKFNMHLNMKMHPGAGHPGSPHGNAGGSDHGQCPHPHNHTNNPNSNKKQ